MNLLDRYIGRAVAFGMLLTLSLVLVLIAFFSLVNELEEVGKGAYTTAMAFSYVGLILPRFAYEVFPVATLLGSLIGLGSLASSSELVAMRAAGVSVSRIVGSVLKTGLVLLVVVVAVGEMLAPLSEQRAQRMKMEALSSQVALQTRYGFWSRDGDTYINIRAFLPDSSLADVYIYEYDPDHSMRRITHARRAVLIDGEWELQDLAQSDFWEQKIFSQKLAGLRWPGLLEPELLDVVTVQPHMLPAWDLWAYVAFLKQNGLSAAQYEVAFWSKLVVPLVTLVMLFLSIPFVFGPLRSVGIGQRVFTGAVVGTLFFMFNRVFTYLGVVYEFNALFTAAFPTLLFLLVALLFFRRVT
ncbi:LPS export ABC transporter permease LptG [Candidatus Endoriftia persephonae]|jgi:lipopolysaccharide export system permease protein|uniref:Lipopolysaccharide export system permease protein LptG n=2 Tax=Gammaproteobacteria TaxID=1236 RepID=G2FC03_9GAMM|nr:LPS export ABC transporter permease LptG [Candidatus Endoriftia persephone]EGW55834.1 lipopolysaccharide export system permease protein LptG [endosymbiont of Tevnia jerichonana (vent Tica)]USF86196.1 LPS export ABC transporter permease LptG [Candidatus Endoriftia persephone]